MKKNHHLLARAASLFVSYGRCIPREHHEPRYPAPHALCGSIFQAIPAVGCTRGGICRNGGRRRHVL
eukprot:scaffold4599_cov219-Amphora_coffeaeformis.AAC.4